MDNITDIGSPEFDFQALTAALKGYKQPKLRISLMQKNGVIVRVKKGLYVFGDIPGYPKYSPEVLANLIYGPSYISLEYALSYYQLIPEKAAVISSVTTQRSRSFTTPVGRYSYQHIPPVLYSQGYTRVTVGTRSFLMATKEKALTDILFVGSKIRSVKQIEARLHDDLRVAREDVLAMDISAIEQCHNAYRHSSTEYLIKYIRGNHG